MLTLVLSLCLKSSEATRILDPLHLAAAQFAFACHLPISLPAAAIVEGYFSFKNCEFLFFL